MTEILRKITTLHCKELALDLKYLPVPYKIPTFVPHVKVKQSKILCCLYIYLCKMLILIRM